MPTPVSAKNKRGLRTSANEAEEIVCEMNIRPKISNNAALEAGKDSNNNPDELQRKDEKLHPGRSNGAEPDEPNSKQFSNARANDANGGANEPPRPLIRELPPPDPFPIDALGEFLGLAARAIHERVQCPVAICGQAVISAATLSAQAHADVQLPTGQVRPISNFFITIAETGERKTAADNEALWPVRKREKALREAYDAALPSYENQKIAWERARDYAVKKAKGDPNAIKSALDALGPAPMALLVPLLTCPEPTYEGLCRLLAVSEPSVGVFSSEGGQFIGGHSLSEEKKLLTAAGLSGLWDGEPIKRVRAGDGTSILPGRRVAMHLMAQPDVAAIREPDTSADAAIKRLLSDQMLLGQGFLSRCLVSAPDSISGTRLWRKLHATGFAQLYDGLNDRDVLIGKADRQEPLVVLCMSTAKSAA
jgi:hypothetical protein